jgi:hypothetical protein
VLCEIYRIAKINSRKGLAMFREVTSPTRWDAAACRRFVNDLYKLCGGSKYARYEYIKRNVVAWNFEPDTYERMMMFAALKCGI